MRRALLTIPALVLLIQTAAVAQSAPQDPTTYRLTGTRLAIAQDVRIERDEEVSDVAIVVGGNLDVAGRVRDGIVVVGGDLRLAPTADVRGDIVLVGGTLTRDPGARQIGNVNYVNVGNWSSRIGWWPTIRLGEFGRWLSLAATLARVSSLAVLMLALLVVARTRVARVGRAALAEPMRAFLVGFAAEIFFVPLLIAASISLVITIVGIPFVAVLVPIAIASLIFAFVLGFTSLACRLGEWIEDRLGWQPGNAYVATGIGFLLLVGPTLAARLINIATDAAWPLTFALVSIGLAVEFVAWTMGLGASILTGLGRWYTVPPPIVVDPAEPQPAASM